MPTRIELDAEVAELKARLAAAPSGNYMQRVNPNLIIVLHYTGKALWLALAALFGIIGYQLYAVGIKSVGNADATLPLGISFSLHDAGPGLVVMVIALLCSLVGAVKARVELTPEAIRLMGHPGPHPDLVRTPEVVNLNRIFEKELSATEAAFSAFVPVEKPAAKTSLDQHSYQGLVEGAVSGNRVEVVDMTWRDLDRMNCNRINRQGPRGDRFEGACKQLERIRDLAARFNGLAALTTDFKFSLTLQQTTRYVNLAFAVGRLLR
jgi:hypothetical protein